MKLALMPLLVVLINLTPLIADTVELSNGDRLSGQVEGLDSAKLTLQTTYAGTVMIQWDQIETLSTSEPFVVEFNNGESAIGSISSPEPGTLQIGSNSSVAVAQVVAIRRETAVPSKPGFFASWQGSADAGYTFSRGNTRIDNLSISFQPERRTAVDRTLVQVRSLYSVQEEGTSSNMHLGQVRYDRFLTPRTFVFTQGRIETDQRERLDLRTSEGGGFGMEFQIDPDTVVSIFAGMTFLQEDFEGLARKLSAEVLTGLEVETVRFKPFLLGSTSQLLPILTDDRYRVEWTAGIRIPLVGGFNLGVEMFDNFDSAPPQVDIKKNDFGLLSTFGLTF